MRPDLRELFVAPPKRLEIFFYTSNIAKFLHARTVFERYGLLVRHFVSKHDPYSEDYSRGRQELLRGALDEVLASVGRASLVFVEDTSVRIDALSAGGNDFPGLRIKEWFGAVSFEELDAGLKKRGGNRSALVRSDIALHVPDLGHAVHFEGITAGRVAETPPAFDESPEHPWLTPDSFNGWFVPNGSTRRLGEMSLDESWEHDFRIRAFRALMDRLEEYSAILNLPTQAYSRTPQASPALQLPLPYFAMPGLGGPLMVVGHTCAGKTTFGNRASREHGVRFIEASDTLRSLARESGPKGDDPFALAAMVLAEKGADVVAREILRVFSSELGSRPVIAGFRTVEEVDAMKRRHPRARLVLVEASERTRFERHVRRGRAAGPRTLEEFRKLDANQASLGLLPAAQDLADVRVVNEGSLSEYYAQVDAVVTDSRPDDVHGVTTNVRPRHDLGRSQLLRCLAVLDKSAGPLSCDEIEEATRADGRPILHNNANKVLKRGPAFARRLETPSGRVRYGITDAGRAYLRLMRGRLPGNGPASVG